MNVFILGLRVTATAAEDEGTVNVLAESLPSNEKRVATKVQLLQKADHYVGKLLSKFEEGQTVLAVGPTRPTPDGVLRLGCWSHAANARRCSADATNARGN